MWARSPDTSRMFSLTGESGSAGAEAGASGRDCVSGVDQAEATRAAASKPATRTADLIFMGRAFLKQRAAVPGGGEGNRFPDRRASPECVSMYRSILSREE